MTDNEKLEQLRMELARQDEALDHARRQIEGLAGLDITVPASWLDELEEACAPQAYAPTAIMIGIRA